MKHYSAQDFLKIPVVGLRYENLGTAPTGLGTSDKGYTYFDTSLGYSREWSGTAWIDHNNVPGTGVVTSGMILDGTITDTDVASANKDGSAGTPSLRTLGTSAQQAVSGTDSRLSDNRTPIDGSVTGGTAGTGVKIATGTITDANVAAANKDGAAATPSLRTLGNGASQAVSGTDSRLSDTRTPTAGSVTNNEVAANAGIVATKLDSASFNTQVRTNRLDQMATPTATVSMGSQEVTNVGTPNGPNSAAPKTYVDTAVANARAGLSVKDPVIAVASSNVNLAAPGATIDGVTMATGNRFLAAAQTTSTQNGLYVWNGAAAAATRSTDADGVGEIFDGTLVAVGQGTQAGTQWIQTATDPGTAIGAWTQTWTTFSSGGQTYTAGAGLTLTSGTIDVVALDGSITVAADTITVGNVPLTKGGTGGTSAVTARANLGATTKVAVTGPGTSTTNWVINHALANADVLVQLREVATNAVVDADVVLTDANNVTVTFATAPTANAFRAVVIG